MKLITRRIVIAAALAAGSMTAMAQNKVNLGVSIPTATHGFTGAVVYWAGEAKKDLEKKYPDLKITVRTAANASEQANQLQDLVSVTKINNLLVFPFESAALTKPVAQIHDKGVYTVVVDRGLTDTSAQDAYISNDNVSFSRNAGEFIAKALNGKGDIVILRGIATTVDTERVDNFNAVMKNYPGIKIMDAKFGNWNRDDAFKVMQDYLTRFKHIDAVWAADDDMAVGVLKAIDQAKRTDIKLVFGGASMKGMIKTLIDGSDPRIQGNIWFSPRFIYEAIRITAEARLKGEKLPATTIFPSPLVTKENAKQYYFPDSPF